MDIGARVQTTCNPVKIALVLVSGYLRMAVWFRLAIWRISESNKPLSDVFLVRSTQNKATTVEQQLSLLDE